MTHNVRLADKFNTAIENAIDVWRKKALEENGVPVSACLRIAHGIDPQFRYEPNGDNQFTLLFSDGSDVVLDD